MDKENKTIKFILTLILLNTAIAIITIPYISKYTVGLIVGAVLPITLVLKFMVTQSFTD